MTPYQVVRAVQEGKRVYRVSRQNRVDGTEIERYIWATSIVNAESKFPGWKATEFANFILRTGGENV
jgi:hypothetical protein